MTPSQCATARELLKWTRPQLASAAGWAFATIVDFEMSAGTVSTDAIADIRAALESAGVEFIPENGGGPGVRLRKVRPDNTAAKTIPLDDLNTENDE